MRSFSLELESLDTAEHWRLAQVWHDGSFVYMILSETGALVRLEDLTAADRARVERDLNFWLEAV